LNLRYNQPIHYNNKALSLPSYEFNSYFWVGYSKSKMAHGRGKLWTVGAKRYSTEQNSQVETQKTKKQTKWKQNPHY
jgi:hypothetical protein